MNPEFIRRNVSGILLWVFLTFSLVCLTNRVDPYVNGLKSLVWFLVSPEVVFTGNFFNQVDSLRGRLFKLSQAEGENFILRQQNARMAQNELIRDALEEENNRLRVLLSLHEMEYPEAVAAEVVGRDVRDWFHGVVVNKGGLAGVNFYSAVVAGSSRGAGLVGRVVAVEDATSKVLLITDPVSAVSVSIKGSGDLGLLEGRNQPELIVRYLSNRSKVKKGDQVITVGLGGVFPPGIPVGEVTKVSTTKDGFFKEAHVVPLIDFGSLLEVLILERTKIVKEEEAR